MSVDPQRQRIAGEDLQQVAEELPIYRVMFLAPTAKDAFLRFSTWIMALVNQLDSNAPKLEDSLVYTLPNLLFDIPYEIFRVLKRTNQNLYEENPSFYSGCLQGTTF